MPTGPWSAHTLSLITRRHDAINCEHYCPFIIVFLKWIKCFLLNVAKSIFSEQKYLFCLTFSRCHLPINLDLAEVNNPHFILGLFLRCKIYFLITLHCYKRTTFIKCLLCRWSILVYAIHIYTHHRNSRM